MPAESIEEEVLGRVKDGMVLAFGTSTLGENLLLALADKIKEKELNVSVVPTSFRINELLQEQGIPLANINDMEIDLAVEFAHAADEQFNFTKKNSTSLVRDKMIALSALDLVAVVHADRYSKKMERFIPMEVVEFGLKKTMLQLENFGRVNLRTEKGKVYRTETNNLLVDVLVDKVYDLDEIEIESKRIPGVLETGLFIGYADTLILKKDDSFEVKSRLRP
jgi:ribose 5-phosphate isomerase A